MQLAPGVIRVPGRAGVAPVRVARPEGQADTAPERLADRAASSRATSSMVALARAVVHRAVVPGVDVAGEQDEAVLLAPPPARRPDAGSASSRCARAWSCRTRSGPAGQPRAQPLTVDRRDRQARRGRNPPRGLRGGRAPDRRHDHVVQVIHEDEDLPERARLLGGPRAARRGQPVARARSCPRPRVRSPPAAPSPTSTTSASSASTDVENECVSALDHGAVRQE